MKVSKALWARITCLVLLSLWIVLPSSPLAGQARVISGAGPAIGPPLHRHEPYRPAWFDRVQLFGFSWGYYINQDPSVDLLPFTGQGWGFSVF